MSCEPSGVRLGLGDGLAAGLGEAVPDAVAEGLADALAGALADGLPVGLAVGLGAALSDALGPGSALVTVSVYQSDIPVMVTEVRFAVHTPTSCVRAVCAANTPVPLTVSTASGDRASTSGGTTTTEASICAVGVAESPGLIMLATTPTANRISPSTPAMRPAVRNVTGKTPYIRQDTLGVTHERGQPSLWFRLSRALPCYRRPLRWTSDSGKRRSAHVRGEPPVPCHDAWL